MSPCISPTAGHLLGKLASYPASLCPTPHAIAHIPSPSAPPVPAEIVVGFVGPLSQDILVVVLDEEWPVVVIRRQNLPRSELRDRAIVQGCLRDRRPSWSTVMVLETIRAIILPPAQSAHCVTSCVILQQQQRPLFLRRDVARTAAGPGGQQRVCSEIC